MAKKSSTVKEIIQIVVFLLIVGILLTAFVIYPLGATKTLFGRANLDEYNPDSLGVNDPTPFIEAGFKVDTFSVEPETFTRLAAVRLGPIDATQDGAEPDKSPDEWRGTAVLLNDERFDMASMIPLARRLVDSGFSVVLYDQRATGLSTAEYHSDGQNESSDLEEVITYLRFRELLYHPFIAVGYSVGADAAMLTSLEDSRIDAVVAVDPYLSTDRWIDVLKSEQGIWWLPFYKTIYWFWYGMRSDNAAPYRETDNLIAPVKPTLLIAGNELRESDEYKHLLEISNQDILFTADRPADNEQLLDEIVRFTVKQEGNSAEAPDSQTE